MASSRSVTSIRQPFKSVIYIAILLIFDFCYLVNSAVTTASNTSFVGGIVFVPTVVLLNQIGFQHILNPKPITLQGNCFFEKGISVYGFCKPIFLGSVHLFALVQFFP